jgi:DNA polymerase III subunit alpha
MPHAPETFVHLHNHTEFSLLDGASRITAMVARAAELEMPALALTDHGVMYGAILFYKACRQAGIKPILGFEAYVAPRGRFDREGRVDRDPYHLTILAADAEGYRNLMALCTIGQKEGLYYKPRIDREVLAAHSRGLIVLSGCLGGEVATKITQGDVEGARETVATYRDIFGPDRYLLEVQRHRIEAQEAVNEALKGFSREFGLRLAATNDLHYVHQHDAEPHDVLLCLQTGANFEDPKRWRFESQDFYLKSAADMAQVFEDLPAALASTLEVADQVDLRLEMGRSLLPPFEVPAGLTHDQYLRQKVEEGLRWRYGDDPSRAARDRMDVELEVIRQTGYASYFLIVADFYEFARRQGIVTGPGRGSAAGSLVAYSLGITNLDPLEHGLLFERFLNKDRVSMPDIDCDFSVEGRERVIRYVAERYGADRVAQIITFTTMASKAAIRDVGRVLEVPLKETDRLAKLVPVHQGRSKSLEDTLGEVPEFREAYEAPPQQGPDGRAYHLRRLIDVARTLEGVSRNVSVHAAGVVIAPDRLERFAPTQWGPRSAGAAADDQSRQVITQYDMHAVAEIGLLKMDFLGLQNLDIISTCLKLVREHRGEEIDLLELGFEDPKTYELISRADTHGVFQLEGSGMRRMLEEMRPQSFADVTAAIALFRPGPMQNIPAYIARKQGREPIEYMHPRLEPILRDSYGVMIYQEQVMMAARELAGFTLSEADILRAAMGKKDAAKMAQQREKFVNGCIKTGVGQKMGEELFDAIAKFASYGFNRSHAAAYAMISYQTAYLKANYPVEYMTSLLTHMQGSADKVAAAIVDARKRGLQVQPPDINESRADFSIVDGGIRFGLAAIKNVGRGAVEQIVQERDASGPFKSLDDFCDRMAGVQDVNARALDGLVRSGACDVFGERNQLLATLEKARQRAEQARRDRESGQISLFGMVEEPQAAQMDYGVPQAPPMPPEERLRSEKELLGLYLSDHPLNRIEEELAQVTDTPLVELTSELMGREVRIGGLVRAWRRVVTRKGQIMAYAEVEDLTGMVEVTFFPRAYDDFRRFMEQPDAVVIIQGKVDTARGGGGRPAAPQAVDEELDAEEEEQEAVTLIADAVWDWSHREDIEPLERQRMVHVEVPEAGPDVVDELAAVLARFGGGSDEVFLHFRVQGSQVTVQVGDRFRVAASPSLKAALDSHFGREVTRLETVRPRAQANGNGQGRGPGRNGNGNGNGNGRHGR